MLTEVFNRTVRVSPALGRSMIRAWYRMLVLLDREREITFMNYGYADLGSDRHAIDQDDRDNQFCIQLYHHVAHAVDLDGRDVVEVGSGRGGGAAYIARRLKPRSMIGIDLAEKAVDFCNHHYSVPGLSFQQGDAEQLPLADESADAVVNLESSHCYGSMRRFLQEVSRVLRPGGYFLFSDHRDQDKLEALRQQLKESGLQLRKETDITANVVLALDLDNDRKAELIRRRCPKLLKRRMEEFAAMKGTRTYETFRTGYSRYMSYVLQK